ncbi:MAG: hypothetical protein RLZZ172_592 [Bacteroidota bacterium]|jgi:hypothetical protein
MTPPPRHLPSAGKLIRLRLQRSLIRATPPGQEGNKLNLTAQCVQICKMT